MYRKLGLLSVPIGVIALIVISFLPGSGVAQQSIAIGGTSIRTDRNLYRVGDAITICYSIPPGQTPIMLIDQTPDGRRTVVLQGVDDGTGGCFQSVVTPPTGTECLRLVVFPPGFNPPYTAAGLTAPTNLVGVIGDATTCFRVQEAIGPLPPPSTGVSVSTDRKQYLVGDQVQACYTVPVSGAVVITDLLANGTSQTVLAGDTTQGTTCLPAGSVNAGPATGNECLRVDAYLSRGASLYGSAQTCFMVVPRVQPQPVPQGPGLRINKQQFRIGEFVQVCYAPPGPGQVTLTLTAPNGATAGQLVSGQDDGSGGCTAVQATLPFGRWCITMTWVGGGQGTQSFGQFPATPAVNSPVCYQVIGAG